MQRRAVIGAGGGRHTVAWHVLSQRKLAWGILAEPVDVDVTESRLASRREIAGEIAARIEAASTPDICPRRHRIGRNRAACARCMSRWSAPWRRTTRTIREGCATPFKP